MMWYKMNEVDVVVMEVATCYDAMNYDIIGQFGYVGYIMINVKLDIVWMIYGCIDMCIYVA